MYIATPVQAQSITLDTAGMTYIYIMTILLSKHATYVQIMTNIKFQGVWPGLPPQTVMDIDVYSFAISRLYSCQSARMYMLHSSLS